jgi:hypothetical protein
MIMIVEPLEYAKEEILKIPIAGGAIKCLVISGYADFTNSGGGSVVKGDEDDDLHVVKYTAHLVVGPNWISVRDVSPIVTRSGFYHTDSDEADATGYQIFSCTWDTVGSGEPNPGVERIRLKVEIELRGGSSSRLSSLAYHLVANGVLANP